MLEVNYKDLFELISQALASEISSKSSIQLDA